MSIDIHHINDCRARIKQAAADILAGELSYIEGARLIVALLGDARVDAHTPPFVSFVSIHSEIDSFPLGKARKMWNSEALEKLDAELVRVEAWARGYAEEACRDIVESDVLKPLGSD